MWLKFKIPIETDVKPIKFELWLPIENANESDIGTPESGDQDSNDLNAKVLLQRSISGKRAHSVINCNYLIPLTLNVILPDAYPSEVKPHYIISSIWLNEQQLNSLSLKLDEIWNENFNMPVLYTWCEWLQHNLINHLDLFESPNKIIVTPVSFELDNEINSSENAKHIVNYERINCLFEDSQEMFFQLFRYFDRYLF